MRRARRRGFRIRRPNFRKGQQPWLRLIRVSVAAGVLLLGAGDWPGAAQATNALGPDRFAQLSTGVALVRSYNCSGSADEGTGFLVGSRLLMTARHVVAAACKVNVLIGGHWQTARDWSSWHTKGSNNLSSVDVETITLANRVNGHIFSIRQSSPSIGTELAALGHPLGAGISLTQGSLYSKSEYRGVPILVVRLLGAEGGSGSPIVDSTGAVAGILQDGLGGTDVLGQHTSGLIVGIDLPTWWPTAEQDLCRVYPTSGVPGCSNGGSTSPTARPPTKPSPPPQAPTGLHITRAWLSLAQGGLRVHSVTSNATIYLNLDYSRVPHVNETHAIAIEVVRPDGTILSSSTYNVQPGYSGYVIDWTLTQDGLLPMAGTWQFNYSLDGQAKSVQTLNVQRSSHPVSVVLGYDYASYSLRQDLGQHDVLSAKLLDGYGQVVDEAALGDAATFGGDGVWTFTLPYPATPGPWTVRFYLNGELVSSARAPDTP